jgi:PKD repeat protein
MAVSDVFKVYLYADPFVALYDVDYPFPDGEEITSGIVNVDIVEGTDTYEGPQEQIDTGQFTIVSRNPNLDPKINPNLKYNSAIKFYDARFGEFFRGYVTDINVEYQRNDNPIITITGTDIFGVMQRVVVSQETHDSIMALSTGPTWNGITFTEFLPYMYDFTSKYLDLTAIAQGTNPQCKGFFFPTSPGSVGSFGQQAVENLNYSPAKYIPQVGETYLDVINKYAQTNLTSFSARGPDTQLGFFYINVYPFAKYDPTFWFPQQDPYLEYPDYDFNSDPNSNKPYETILIDNGYNRVINQIDISNEYRFVDAGELKSESENFTRTSSDSIEDYAISRASMSTIYPEDGDLPNADWADRYSENIFQITGFPGQEIQKITFDNARIEDIENEYPYSRYLINQLVRIKHQINNNETIDRIHNIAGITHNISLNKWEMGFTLKPSKEDNVFTNQGSLPILTMNATSGDANFNFTATIGSVDPERIESIVWALSAIDPDDPTLIYPYALSGNMFKNGLARTGYTQTWNFDDDGILAPYSFDSESTYEEPTDNRYGGYGPGNWNVYAFITLTNGFTIFLQEQLVVGTPAVEANFGWTQNLTTSFGQVSFVDTSVNHETGEPDSYAWTFGDGTTSSERNPVHTYVPTTNENSYGVSLEVYAFGPGETKVYNTHTETVTLAQPTMVPDFTWTLNRQTVTFTNTSTNVGLEEPDAYFWNFGDGTTSTAKNPVKIFAAGDEETVSFNVSLTTRNIWEQTATTTKEVTVEAFDASGTLPISQIRLRIENYTVSRGATSVTKNMYPYIFDMKARTSGNKVNLSYLKPTTTTGTNIAYFQEADGTVAEVTTDLLNLTRDSTITPTDQYALTPFITIPAGSGTSTHTFALTTNLGNPTQFIKDLLLTVRDVGTTGNISLPLSSASTNPIYIDVPNTFGGWTNIGYFQLNTGRVDETKPAGQVTQLVKTMTAIRPMPMNIPYFNYTFSGRTGTFTALETGSSYSWNFGDGNFGGGATASNLYSAPGTYNVTLTTNLIGGGTRVTTEPVIVSAINANSIRYVKIEQPYVDSDTRFGTPTLGNFSLWKDGAKLISNINPTWGGANNAFINDGGLWYSGITTTPTLIDTTALLASTQTQTQLVTGTGVRMRGDDSEYRSQWSGIADFKTAYNVVSEIKIDAAKFLTSIPQPGGFPTWTGNPPANGPTYNIYSSTYTGDTWTTARDGSWTLIGTITPTAMSSTAFTTYTMTPS